MNADAKLYVDFQKHNFFRRPEWRWDRVLNICDRYPSPGRCTRRDDPFIRRAKEFLLRWRNEDNEGSREKLWFDYPGLYYAYDLHRRIAEEPAGAMFLQARLLARQTFEHIATALKTIPDTVRWYEALFFNVNDALDCRDWITGQVIMPAIMTYHNSAKQAAADDGPAVYKDSSVAKPFLDASLKLFAYFGGPFLVDLMIAGFQSGKPLTSQEDMSSWFDQHWSMTVRRRSAQAALQFEINKYNVLELFAVHTRIMEIERSEESQDQARTQTERHIKAMVEEIPWAVGDEGARAHEGTVLGRLDNMAAELRDDEVLLVASGKPVPGLADDFPERLPPPRKQQAAMIGVKETEL